MISTSDGYNPSQAIEQGCVTRCFPFFNKSNGFGTAVQEPEIGRRLIARPQHVRGVGGAHCGEVRRQPIRKPLSIGPRQRESGVQPPSAAAAAEGGCPTFRRGSSSLEN